MANKTLFNSTPGKLAPAADATNEAGGVAYKLSDQGALAQYAATGCLNSTFYASADEQLDMVLGLCGRVPPEFVARTALYCRQRGSMKDAPALMCAALSILSPGLMAEIFDRVIDTPRMLRTYVQIMRSGQIGLRKSLGTLPKRLIRQWLDARSDEAIFFASVGNDPSMADIVKMVHPKPRTPSREALYGYLIGRSYDADVIPKVVKDYEAFKAGSGKIPDVPFQMLTSLPLDTKAWKRIAENGSWQMTRMNLNTFARHGVLESSQMVRMIADRLSDPERIEKARAFPYQLMTAFRMASKGVPREILRALESAMEFSVRHVPEIPGKTYVFVDVSGSMHSPVTGYRRGATTAVRCVDVAALVAASVLRRNPEAEVWAFHDRVFDVRLNPGDTVMTNAEKLASMPWGGTDCSAPLREMNRRRLQADTVIFVSDNESWIDTRPGSGRRGTATMQAWNALRKRCPKAKMACIDIQPYGTTQAKERADILNVGGFSDAVFEVLNLFARDKLGPERWAGVINAMSI